MCDTSHKQPPIQNSQNFPWKKSVLLEPVINLSGCLTVIHKFLCFLTCKFAASISFYTLYNNLPTN